MQKIIPLVPCFTADKLFEFTTFRVDEKVFGRHEDVFRAEETSERRLDIRVAEFFDKF